MDFPNVKKAFLSVQEDLGIVSDGQKELLAAFAQVFNTFDACTLRDPFSRECAAKVQ